MRTGRRKAARRHLLTLRSFLMIFLHKGYAVVQRSRLGRLRTWIIRPLALAASSNAPRSNLAMNLDIGPIIEDWEFDPNDICARKIVGVDGRPKLQVRLDLGLLQMEMEGRPDGQRPFGRESLLEHYEGERDAYRTEHGTDAGFQLDHETCASLGQ